MKTRYLLILMVLTGCSSMLNTKTTSLNNTNLNFTSSYSDTENDIPYYNCNDFADNALNIYSLEYLQSSFYKNHSCTKNPVYNLHDSSVVDTLYQFSSKTNFIEYYKGTYNKFVTKFEVTHSRYELHGGVSVGNSKNTFKKKFNIEEEIGDAVSIGNMSKTAIYTFYFHNDKINKISSSLYID